MKKTRGGKKMLYIVKDNFDESPEDILNFINNMLKNKEKEKTEKNTKEENKE